MSDGARRWTNVALALGSVLLTLAAVEAFVRWTKLWIKPDTEQPGIYEASSIPGVPYTMRKKLDREWAGHRIVTNSDGLRESREFGRKKPGLKRILMLGDSFTFGFGVAQSDSYPRKLEALLNANGNTAYEVINAGVSGFNAEDESHFLEYLMPKYRPDVVVWSLVGNDWDDSLSVAPDGKLTSDKASYAATSEWLGSWGLEGPYVYRHFRLSMNEAGWAWADGRRYTPERNALDGWFGRWSYAYCFFRARLASPAVLKAQQPIPNEPYFARVQRIGIGGGEWDAPPEIASIYLSPRYRQRFSDAVARAGRLCEREKAPLVIYGFSIPFDERLPRGAYYRDITQYVGQPYYRFYLTHNLGWDAHLNPAGNRVIAEAMLETLGELGLARTRFHSKRPFHDKAGFWKEYAAIRERYERTFVAPYVDFEHFDGVHQLVGGLYPPRVFPIKEDARLSLILKSGGGRTLAVRGRNLSAREQQIGVRAGGAPFRAKLQPGPFEVTFDSPGGDGIVDITVECESRPCRDIEVRYIGFGNAAAGRVKP